MIQLHYISINGGGCKLKSKYKYYVSSNIFVFIILVSFVGVSYLTQSIIRDNRSHYENSVADAISNDMKLEIQQYIDKIESMRLFVEERRISGIDYDEFYLFASGLFDNDVSLENIAISPNSVHEFVYPTDYNHIVGYNLLEDEREHVVEAVTRARDDNEIVISGPYPNRTDDTVSIVVIRYPVYYDNGDFYGLINVVLKTTKFFEPNDSSQYDDIYFQVKDENEEILYGDEFDDSIDTIDSMPLEFFGWRIEFGRSEAYSDSISKENIVADSLFILIFSITVVTGIIFIISNGKSKFEKEKRTLELVKANENLAYKNFEVEKERESAQKYLKDFKEAGSIFENSITNAPLPIMIHSEDGMVLNLSKEWTKLTGYQLNDIPTIYDWTEKAYGQNKEEVINFIHKLYKLTTIQHDGEFVVTTKDGRKLTWDFNSGYIGRLPNGKAVAMSVATDVTERIRIEHEITFLSYHDLLTGLYNRRFFEEQLKHLDNPRNLPMSIIMGDVNGLKLINDAFGHQTGDQLLKMIGNIISSSIRGNDIAARWGGDEFTILLPTSETDEANVLVNRIQKKIKESSFEYGNLSISFGLCTKRYKEEDINKIFASAEELMYQNKLIEIDSIRGETINTIMNTLFEKSAEVKEHSMRVSKHSVMIAESMGLSQAKVNDIKTIGLIHDIGKIVIDLHILDKPGKLSDEERKIIEQHPLSGSRMLNSSHEYSRLSAGVLHHHERIDGTGYPNGIRGDQIPLESKIIAVADAYDAMTAERPYRLNPLSIGEAISELQKHSGTQFDKTIVDVFVCKVLGNIK